MNAQHLSDEAVAAFADGVLTGHARERATKHVEACGECRTAVQVQREAAWALRAAPAPALPNTLADRLRSVPMTTPITTLPTVVTPDGSTMLATFAPAAALVPSQTPKSRRTKPFVTTAAVVALAGALTAGSVARDSEQPQTGSGSTVHAGPSGSSGGGPADVVRPVSVFRAHQP